MEKPPETTLVEVAPTPPPSIPEETPEPLKDEQSEIPDWLKPLPKTSSINSQSSNTDKSENKTTVTTDTTSILSVPEDKTLDQGSLSGNESDISTSDGVAPIHEDEELVPDWLKPTGSSTDITNSEQSDALALTDNMEASDDEYVPPAIDIPPASTELPEWLKASASETSTLQEEKKEKKPVETKKKKTVKKPPSAPKNQGVLPEKKTSNDDIPDWLK